MFLLVAGVGKLAVPGDLAAVTEMVFYRRERFCRCAVVLKEGLFVLIFRRRRSCGIRVRIRVTCL